jgi:hypothetical protein
MDLRFKLTEALDRIITDKNLEGLSDKQIKYLDMLAENVLTPNENAFYYKSKGESIAIIKDILKISNKIGDKKEFYLNNKGII